MSYTAVIQSKKCRLLNLESKILSTKLSHKLLFFWLASIVYLSEQKYFVDPFIDNCKKNLYHRPARRDCFR